jgi:hypothetical protein
MGLSMSGASKMSYQMSFMNLLNATSSPASASGATPFGKPDGRTTAPYGPDRVRASLSARQAKVQGLLTSGTCGQRGITSSASVALQQSLASRLQAKMALVGSTLFNLTWKQRATPSGLLIFALRASARRTSDNDCFSWPTPVADAGGQPDKQSFTGKFFMPQGAETKWRDHRVVYSSANGSMANADNAERRSGGAGGNEPQWANTGRAQDASHVERGSAVCELADAAIIGRVGRRASETGNEPGEVKRLDGLCDVGRVDHATDARRQAAGKHDGGSSLQSTRSKQLSPDGCRSRPTNGFWGAADWLYCTDGRWRPVEPGTSPLAHGSPARVGRLRGYGNAIVAPLAQTFIEEAMRCIDA